MRTACVIALTPADIVYLDESDYQRLFKERIEMGLFMTSVMKTLVGEESCSRMLAGQLSEHFDKKEVRYGSTIYKEG